MPYSNRYNSDISTSAYGRLDLKPLNLERQGNAFRDAIATLNEQQQKTNEVAAAVTAAFQNAKLHHSEDEYKKNRADYYYNEIMKDPFDFVKAQRLATEAANDTEFLTKIRTNQEYEDFRSQVEDYRNKGQIDDITAERLLQEEDNQYKYTPTYDNMGRIVGSSRWVAGKMPVKKVDRVQLFALAQQMIKPKKGSTGTETQSSVTNADGTGKGSLSASNVQFERVDEKDLQEIFNGVFESYPGAQDALMQDYEDDIYRIQKAERALMTEDNTIQRSKLQSEIDMTKQRLYDENGIMRSPEAYMAYSMGMIIPHGAYDWKFTDTKSHSTVDNYGGGGGGSGANAAAALQSFLGGDYDRFINGTTMGGPVLINRSDYASAFVTALTGINDMLYKIQNMDFGNYKPKQ